MFLKRTLPIIVAFFFGILGMVLYYIPHPTAQHVLDSVNTWERVISAFALFLGVSSLIHVHALKIRRKGPGWGYSILVYIGFFVTLLMSLFNEGKFMFTNRVEAGMVDWVYNYIVNPAQSSMFAMLAFFVASSAFRTFRAKSIEAGILLAAALIVMFGQVPISALVSDKFPLFAAWLLAVPNLAVKRALLFGVCLGSVATSLRIIFGVERSYLGGE